MLYDIESRFDSQDAWPADPSRKEEAQARRALEHMKSLPLLPLVFANHPSRSASGVGVYGSNEPRELRANNNARTEVYRGMEGAPGIRPARLHRTDRRSGTRPGSPPGIAAATAAKAPARSAASTR